MVNRQDPHARVVHAAADAAENVPGVAFLRPGLADLLRGGERPRAGGVRARRETDSESWHIELHLAVHAGHRALDVVRAVRTDVAGAVRATLAPGARGGAARVTVRVTVSNIA